MKKVFLATDHAGFEMKEGVKEYLLSNDYSVEDLGAHSFNPTDDYPFYIHKLGNKVSNHSDVFGIIFGGSGQGEAIVANRYSGVRAIVYASNNHKTIILGREHNNANVLSIGARFITQEEAEEAVDLFLSTTFKAEDRHLRRINSIDDI